LSEGRKSIFSLKDQEHSSDNAPVSGIEAAIVL